MGLSCRTAVSFDAVAVGILEEGRVVVGTIIGSRTGPAVVTTAMLKPGAVEAIHAFPGWRRETDVQSGSGLIRCRLLGFEHPKLDRFAPISQRAGIFAQAAVAERR